MYIGVVAKNQADWFGIDTNYLEWASLLGTPILIPPTSLEEFKDIFLPKLNGIILPGGSDVDAKRYGKIPGFFTGKTDQFLEAFDNNILPEIIGKIPIFGICRGLQTINVAFGGNLHQNIWFHPYSDYENHEVHTVSSLDGKLRFKVNSFHHQAIADLGEGLSIELMSNDRQIEAISCMDKKIFAVQWHPERLKDDYSVDAFYSILE